MGVENVACPHCGMEALVTVPGGQSVQEVYQNPSFGNQQTACRHCKCTFGVVTR